MASIKKAILRNFNATEHIAEVELTGSGKVYLENVPVSRNIPSSEMVTGREIAVVFFDEHNAKDAVIVAVY